MIIRNTLFEPSHHDEVSHAEETQQQKAAAHYSDVRAQAFKRGQSVYEGDCKGNYWQTWILETVAADHHVIYECSTGMRNGECRCQVHQRKPWWEQLSDEEEAGQTWVNEAAPSSGEMAHT